MKNNLEDITKKLGYLAEHHARELTCHKQNHNLTAPGEFNLKALAEAVISLDFLSAFDKATVMQTIDVLEISIKDLLHSSILTQSRNGKKQMPVAFDALVEIFTYTHEIFRQQYFQQLTTLYYKELCRSLRTLKSEEPLDKVNYDQQVKILLPLVKLRLATQWSQENTFKTDNDKHQLLSNIASYFKFPLLNQEDIYEVVRNKVGSSNFNLQSYELVPLNEKNGHLGEYFKLKVALSIKEETKNFDLFAKFLTPKAEVIKKIVLSGPSKKEEFFYITYMPLLEKYGLKSLLNFVPRCYFSRLNDVLILDDMAAKGFIGLTPNIQLKYDALHKVVQKMANFHSATMIFEEMLSQKEEKRITVNDLYAEFLQEAFFVPDDDYFLKTYFDVGLDTIQYIARKFPELTKKFSEEYIKGKINQGWRLHFEKIKFSPSLKSTMCHGDMYVANMLFKFNEEEICQDVTLIDFQILRYCPPTHDLLFFLHQSCTKEDRNKYLKQLCDEYYEELSKNMAYFGFDINKVYPKEDFETSLRYMKSQAVFHALYYSPITMLSPKLREDIFSSQEQADYYMKKNRGKLVDIGLEDDIYKTVMKRLIEDLVELCENGDL